MGEHHDEDVPVWCNVRRTVNTPCKCCCSLCGGWVFLIVLLALLARTSDDFVEFSIDVPFYNQAELNRQQQDAIDAMRADADVLSVLTLSSNALDCVNSGTSIARNGTSLGGPAPSPTCQTSSTQVFRVVYISSDRSSNILTAANLEEIRKVKKPGLARVLAASAASASLAAAS